MREGEFYRVRGRVYGTHDGRFCPISGPGIHSLSRGEFKALGLLNTLGDNSRMLAIAEAAGISILAKAALADK